MATEQAETGTQTWSENQEREKVFGIIDGFEISAHRSNIKVMVKGSDVFIFV